MQFAPDRRHHKRFDMTSKPNTLALVRETNRGLELVNCTLVNLSYGGLCFRAPWPVREQEECQFLLDLKLQTKRLALVKARICWVKDLEPEDHVSGAVFLESTLGWTGPEESN